MIDGTRGAEPDEARCRPYPGAMTTGADAAWDAGLAALLRYVDTRGPGRISHSARAGGLDVGGWAETQREAYWGGHLDGEQASRLAAVPGWTWDGAAQRRWQSALAALRRHVADAGRVPVPGNARAGKSRVGAWVHAQRRAHRDGTLPEPLARMVESVPGWVWTEEDARWQLGYAALRRFAAVHGHTEVPRGAEVDGFHLGAWVQRIRLDHRENTLGRDREALLTGLPGWRWTTTTTTRWQRGCSILQAYADRTGHSRPPQSTVVDGFGLGVWVNNRRREYRTGRLAPDRVAHLESLPGWSWSPRADGIDHRG